MSHSYRATEAADHSENAIRDLLGNDGSLMAEGPARQDRLGAPPGESDDPCIPRLTILALAEDRPAMWL